MKVLNVHESALPATHEEICALIDSLGSPRDTLWPHQSWPKMQLDQPLRIGARGGHGPIRYVVEAYVPGQSIRFRFTGPKGFDGYHSYEIAKAFDSSVLRHTVQMTTRGLAVLSWPLLFSPLHDALIEDSLATARASLGQPPNPRPWSPWVRFLRWVVSGGKARSQVTPHPSLHRTRSGGLRPPTRGG